MKGFEPDPTSNPDRIQAKQAIPKMVEMLNAARTSDSDIVSFTLDHDLIPGEISDRFHTGQPAFEPEHVYNLLFQGDWETFNHMSAEDVKAISESYGGAEEQQKRAEVRRQKRDEEWLSHRENQEFLRANPPVQGRDLSVVLAKVDANFHAMDPSSLAAVTDAQTAGVLNANTIAVHAAIFDTLRAITIAKITKKLNPIVATNYALICDTLVAAEVAKTAEAAQAAKAAKAANAAGNAGDASPA